MAKLTAAQARDLAQEFYRLSKELGDYRFNHWNELTKDDRLAIEALEWSLLNASSDFTASSIGVSLEDATSVVARVRRAARTMKAAVKRAERVEKVIGIASAAVKLTAAIVSGSPSAIASALDRALKRAN